MEKMRDGIHVVGAAQPGTVGVRLYDEDMPKPSPQIVLDWLKALGFTEPPVGGTQWERSFPAHHFVITVDTDTEKIHYGQPITVHRGTVTNLENAENLVVLECVVSLLDRGYAPNSIELEVAFVLGHRAGGYLDVLVRRGDRTYLMIECKTAGAEYDKALTQLLNKHDSQLMTYIQQDRDAEHAVIYSSTPVGTKQSVKKIVRTYAGFPCAALMGSNTRELYAGWDKETYSTGLFESEPYSVKEHTLRVRDLLDLTNEDGQALFNSFKEILRRHAVSDLPNAFNKLFNLFICKIIDEDKVRKTDITEFQWGGSEEPALVLERLSRLYERGMREYLRLDVADSADRVSNVVAGLNPEQKREVEQLVAELRQYSNTDFAFIDVFDKSSYDQNAAIVRDLVRLLQRRRLRYTQKQGFMGMFFERLLNTSMKQEAGQFFTPPPIAQFVNEALPIEQIIRDKIASGEAKFLPYGIDYAAGSGHFLTEYMDRVDKVLQDLKADHLESATQRRNLGNWKNELTWAGEFVYGIELDHRLAKTAKVSTFLHGDGDANVIRGNGLASFAKDPDFAAAGPRLQANGEAQDIQRFDVVLANPPYSVAGFAQQVPHGHESFALWPFKGERSDDIESFFVERTKHLLTDGGVAGIVLPTSFLNNDGMETHARALLLKYFDLVAIVSLESRVFIATDIPSIIVFLRRRANSEVDRIAAIVDAYIDKGTTEAVRGVHDAFDTYALTVHKSTPAKLRAAIRKAIDTELDTINNIEWLEQNRSRQGKLTRQDDGTPTQAMRETVVRIERARMEAFFSTMNQHTVVVTSPSAKRPQEAFLGYSFSERRRHEGIRFRSGTSVISTPLFDPENTDNPDKISTLIKRHFDGETIEIPEALQDWTAVYSTGDLVALAETDFKWRIQTRPSDGVYEYAVATERLGTVCNLRIGSTPSRDRPDYFTGDLPWMKISDISTSTYPSASPIITETDEYITAEASEGMALVKKGTLLLSFKLTIGNTAFAGTDLYTNEAIVAFDIKPLPEGVEEWVDKDYLDVLFRRVGARLLGLENVGSKKFGRTLNLGRLRGTHIPVGTGDFREKIKQIDRDAALTDAQKHDAIADVIWKSTAG